MPCRTRTTSIPSGARAVEDHVPADRERVQAGLQLRAAAADARPLRQLLRLLLEAVDQGCGGRRIVGGHVLVDRGQVVCPSALAATWPAPSCAADRSAGARLRPCSPCRSCSPACSCCPPRTCSPIGVGQWSGWYGEATFGHAFNLPRPATPRPAGRRWPAALRVPEMNHKLHVPVCFDIINV